MNYYIQGDPARAEEIKAAFEAKGFECPWEDELGDVQYINISVIADDCAYVDPIMGGLHLLNVLKTHPDYKELELPVKPKFKVGDEIAWIEAKGSKPTEPVKIIKLIDKDQLYMVDMSNGVSYVAYDMQDYYKLVQKPHYDIANFYAGMPVLVRDSDEKKWLYTIFGMYNKDNKIYPFVVVDMRGYPQCIPFEGNEHLLGTTDQCDEQYINW